MRTTSAVTWPAGTYTPTIVDPGTDELRSRAIGYARAILDSSMTPFDGASAIWTDVWARCSHDPADPLGVALAPFAGEASQWDDSSGRWRPEIEASIRRLAEEFLAGPQGQPSP